MFGKIDILQHFENDGIKYGIYWAEFNNERKLFVRNGNSIAVVSHLYQKEPCDCLLTIRSDVTKELIEVIDKQKSI